MSFKSKGTDAERELVHLCWKKDIPAIRVAGSGSSRYPSPDIIAGRIDRKVAIECKSVKADSKYIPKEEVENLKIFATKFGCEPWIGVRFAKNDWLFLSLEDLTETKSSFMISKEKAKLKGLLLEELWQK
jgi:holliday junction resolvase Hjr